MRPKQTLSRVHHKQLIKATKWVDKQLDAWQAAVKADTDVGFKQEDFSKHYSVPMRIQKLADESRITYELSELTHRRIDARGIAENVLVIVTPDYYSVDMILRLEFA